MGCLRPVPVSLILGSVYHTWHPQVGKFIREVKRTGMYGWACLGFHGAHYKQSGMISSASRPELQPSQTPREEFKPPRSQSHPSFSISHSVLYPIAKSTDPEAGVGGLPLAIPRREKSHRQRVEPRRENAKGRTSLHAKLSHQVRFFAQWSQTVSFMTQASYLPLFCLRGRQPVQQHHCYARCTFRHRHLPSDPLAAASAFTPCRNLTARSRNVGEKNSQ